jgi:hypothetical protein
VPNDVHDDFHSLSFFFATIAVTGCNVSVVVVHGESQPFLSGFYLDVSVLTIPTPSSTISLQLFGCSGFVNRHAGPARSDVHKAYQRPAHAIQHFDRQSSSSRSHCSTDCHWHPIYIQFNRPIRGTVVMLCNFTYSAATVHAIQTS